MENLKSSLKELRSVLVEIQKLTTDNAGAVSSNPVFDIDKEELLALRRFKTQSTVAIESLITKIETALKDLS